MVIVAHCGLAGHRGVSATLRNLKKVFVFDKMKEFKIIDTQEFVKAILDRTKLFRYECSDKNSDPSKKSREVIEILNYEALLLNEEPNLWLGYNDNRVLFWSSIG